MNDNLRKFVYVALVVLAVVSLALAVAVTAGLITDEQVVGTMALALRYATSIAGLAGGIFALRNFKPREYP